MDNARRLFAKKLTTYRCFDSNVHFEAVLKMPASDVAPHDSDVVFETEMVKALRQDNAVNVMHIARNARVYVYDMFENPRVSVSLGV